MSSQEVRNEKYFINYFYFIANCSDSRVEVIIKDHNDIQKNNNKEFGFRPQLIEYYIVARWEKGMYARKLWDELERRQMLYILNYSTYGKDNYIRKIDEYKNGSPKRKVEETDNYCEDNKESEIKRDMEELLQQEKEVLRYEKETALSIQLSLQYKNEIELAIQLSIKEENEKNLKEIKIKENEKKDNEKLKEIKEEEEESDGITLKIYTSDKKQYIEYFDFTTRLMNEMLI